MEKKKWVVYMIESERGMLYTGITNDLKKRFEDHMSGKKGARFFRISKPLKIVYQEGYPNRSEASKREAEIKKMSRGQKLKLKGYV
ncbi:GIY-YIG nuclease family protein [Chlamydiales bacterium]|nr:GIY-YIG nuclease family protein [Chlamydiales bacterium]